jgi:hypothetical protein
LANSIAADRACGQSPGSNILEVIAHANRREITSLRGAIFRESLQRALDSYESVRELGATYP